MEMLEERMVDIGWKPFREDRQRKYFTNGRIKIGVLKTARLSFVDRANIVMEAKKMPPPPRIAVPVRETDIYWEAGLLVMALGLLVWVLHYA